MALGDAPRVLDELGPEAAKLYNTTYSITSGTPAWLGRGLSCVCIQRKGTYERICATLTPIQEERLRRLKNRMKVDFDSSRPDHQEALRALWNATYPETKLQGLISEQWKEMGWQGRDPSTDFRGAGFISLENLLFFAKTFSLMLKQVTHYRWTVGHPMSKQITTVDLMLFLLRTLVHQDAGLL
ncbi:hypothetical protein AMTR_s00013p00199160 [Amborella trichopoda]|uniref:ELMO domain-containing protein n=1 Tax=Amborella trichopoda TaxID=13333 RepID=W1PRR8_AMBTC|nr:hypothetical protein AMTR_s00013p00199160 [Amborella trichopoda]